MARHARQVAATPHRRRPAPGHERVARTELDAHNQAPAGRPLLVPIRVDQQWDVPATQPTELAFDVSYDGGVYWHPARGG